MGIASFVEGSNVLCGGKTICPKVRGLRQPYPIRLAILLVAQLWTMLGSRLLHLNTSPPSVQVKAAVTQEESARTYSVATMSSQKDAQPDEQPFNLDATDLGWSPRKISAVLPCAEEREYAAKTAKAVFENTPPEVLEEVVVVDDGSNP